jgi:hypothetical protein
LFQGRLTQTTRILLFQVEVSFDPLEITSHLTNILIHVLRVAVDLVDDAPKAGKILSEVEKILSDGAQDPDNRRDDKKPKKDQQTQKNTLEAKGSRKDISGSGAYPRSYRDPGKKIAHPDCRYFFIIHKTSLTLPITGIFPLQS